MGTHVNSLLSTARALKSKGGRGEAHAGSKAALERTGGDGKFCVGMFERFSAVCAVGRRGTPHKNV